MLDKQVISYYATKNGYIFEPGIRVSNDKVVEYIDGIRRGGDEVLLVSLEQDFELIRQVKGKSSLMIFQKYGNLKFAYRNREFWCRGFYVDTSGKDTKAIKEYIKNQLEQDKQADQLSIFNPKDPFTGSE